MIDNVRSSEPVEPVPDITRVIAIGVVLHRDHALLAEGYDRVKGETFYRPPGGGVEFGERASEALAREFLEEFERAIEVGALLGVTENLFTFEGRAGHEIVFEYVARFAPESEPGDLEPIEALEGDGVFIARWLPLAEVLAGTHRVYPEGLSERLAAWVNTL